MSRSDLADDPLLVHLPTAEGYRILGGVVLHQKIGQGGMGAVYRGRHLRLNVDVAVKVMVPPKGLVPVEVDAFVKRFIREAQTAAAVRHPNLIRVYDVNVEAGTNYLVMDYIGGESAADRLRRKAASTGGGLPECEAVRICLGAAEGLAAAHRTGIVHRDVKPDNILIDPDGHVVVADLGLAKAFARPDLETALTMGLSVGMQAVGTPHYMSPEQTRSSGTVDPRADVWSLGVTLFRLLTGEFPWDDDDLVDLITRIRRETAPDLRRWAPDVSDATVAVVGRALRKLPAERYAHAGEVAAALGAALAAMGPAGPGSLADPDAGTGKEAAISATPPQPETLTLIGAEAVDAASPQEPTRAASPVGARPSPGASVEPLGEETIRLACPGRVYSVAYSADGRFLAAGCDDARVFVWDAGSGRLLVTLAPSAGQVWSVAFSADSRSLAAACEGHVIVAWSTDDFRTLVTFAEGHRQAVTSVAYSPDKIHLASGGTDRAAVLWDAQFGLSLKTFIVHEMPVWSVAFSPDGRILAAGSEDSTVSLWDVVSGKRTATIDTGVYAVLSVAYSPDGTRIATGRGQRDGDGQGSVVIWNAAGLDAATTIWTGDGAVRCVAFAPDGRRLASASTAGAVSLWDVADGRRIRAFAGHESWVWAVACSPDGARLASGSSDRTVCIWDIGDGAGA